MMFAPATMPWFALHEWRLMWRDGVAMMTGGYPARRIGLIAFIVVVAIALHLMANAIMGPWIANGIVPDKPTLVLITGSGFLFWTVMLSQALESVTRAYYARSDLDLILSSPASSRTLFAVRTGITALTTLLLGGSVSVAAQRLPVTLASSMSMCAENRCITLSGKWSLRASSARTAITVPTTPTTRPSTNRKR